MKKSVRRAGVWVVSTLIVLLGFGGDVVAAKGGGGPPVDEGSGDHGRQKDSDEQGFLLGLIYGDQWVIVRDVSADGDGKPVYFSWQWPSEAYNADGDFDPQPTDLADYEITVTLSDAETGCVQPVSYNEVEGLWEQFYVTDTGAHHYDSYGREMLPTYLIPLDPECKIPDVFAETWGTQVMEVDAGRFNLSRSPQDVIDAAYEEALRIINTAQSIGLDPAGRLLLEIVTLDEFGVEQTSLKTIDSPLENLALYQKILQAGCLADTANVVFTNNAALVAGGLGHLVCSLDPVLDNEDFQRAASFLAGAGDKTGRVTIDLLVYLNNRMELNEITWAEDKRSITSIDYYDFGDFMYDRCTQHRQTRTTLLQPVENAGNYPAQFGVVESVSLFDKRFTNSWPGGFCTVNGNGMIYTFGPGAEVDSDTPIINFVRAADDALSMIGYIHNYALPEWPIEPIEEPVYP